MGATSSGVASRQAPASRTRSRTSGATEAHGSGCAVAAIAPVSKDALSSNAILARIVYPPVDCSGQLAHPTGALFNVRPHDFVDPAQNVGRQLWQNFERFHIFLTCSTLVAPVITVLTLRLTRHHASESCASVHDRSRATDSSCVTMLFLAGSVKPSRKNA